MTQEKQTNKLFSIIWSVLFLIAIQSTLILGIVGQYIVYTAVASLFLINIISLIFIKKSKFDDKLLLLSMFSSQFILIGIMVSEVLIAPSITISPLIVYFGFSFLLIIQVYNSMNSVKNSFVILLTLPILVFTILAQLIVALLDIIFPPKFQELVPYIEVTREMIFSFTQAFASKERIETEQAIDNLGSVSGRVDEIADGYALRKSLGQGIDLGLTFLVFIGLGVLTVMEDDLKIPKEVIFALFASLGLALSTFAGVFGPFYGLTGAAKEFTLRNGNYRGASIYKVLEQLFSIPFKAASAGFLFLDLPPIDVDTLEDFKSEMQGQIDEISDSINSLLGTNSAAVPRKTRKMISSLMKNTEQSLSKLDFRNIRRETNREFALTYYQHEFSWKPWKRKSAVSDFAEKIHFDLQSGEDALRLIGFKIKAGQMDDDMVSNVMVSAALKGVIMMEQKYQELFGDVELGQTCTGLAFGARQFLEDHYLIRNKYKTYLQITKNFLMGLFAIPIVLVMKFHDYFNRLYDELVITLSDVVFDRRGWEMLKIRYFEIKGGLILVPQNFSEKSKKKKSRKKTKEEKAQRNWQVQRKFKKLFSMISEVVIFPFMILFNLSKWIISLFSKSEANARELFEEAVSHAALVSMYEELYKKLVMQTHLSTGY